MNIDDINVFLGKTIYAAPFSVVTTYSDTNFSDPHDINDSSGGYTVIGATDASTFFKARILLQIQDEPGSTTFIDYKDNQFSLSPSSADYYVLSSAGWHHVTAPAWVNAVAAAPGSVADSVQGAASTAVGGVMGFFTKLWRTVMSAGTYGLIGIGTCIVLWIVFKVFKKRKR